MRVRASRLPADAYASLPVTPENAARLRHGRGDDVRIMALLRRTLVKEIAVGAPRFQSRFHRRSGDHLIEETQRSLIRLQFSRHELSTASSPVNFIGSESEPKNSPNGESAPCGLDFEFRPLYRVGWLSRA